MKLNEVDWDRIPMSYGAGANAAAGADPAAIVVPAGKRWRFHGWVGAFTTDATGVNRIIRCTVEGDGTNVSASVRHTAVQAGSVANTYSVWPGAPMQSDTGGTPTMPFPGSNELGPAATINIITTTIQGGDDWGVVRYAYQEAPA